MNSRYFQCSRSSGSSANKHVTGNRGRVELIGQLFEATFSVTQTANKFLAAGMV